MDKKELEKIITENYEYRDYSTSIDPVILDFIDTTPSIITHTTETIAPEIFTKRLTKVADHVMRNQANRTEERLERLTTYNIIGARINGPVLPNSFSTSEVSMVSHMYGYAGNAQEMLMDFKKGPDKIMPATFSFNFRTNAEQLIQQQDPLYAARMNGFIGNSAAHLATLTGRKQWAETAVITYNSCLDYFKENKSAIPYKEIANKRDRLIKNYGLKIK